MTGIAVLIVAAGQGTRAPGPEAKQWRRLAGRTVASWASDAFLFRDGVDLICFVQRGVSNTDAFRAQRGASSTHPVLATLLAEGGDTRQDSVRNGLEALAPRAPERVLIHDAARPFVSPTLIDRVIAALDDADAVAPVLPVTDALHRKADTGFVAVPRDGLFRAQTPQGFRFDAILKAHRKFAGMKVTDDFALAELAGLSLTTVRGEEMNLKMTTNDDFVLAKKIARGMTADIRTGSGFDAHRFSAGDHVWLCGVKIAHSRGLEGHSDADVGLHALTDAILGALGAGDIGVHFPPSDPQWRGQPSQLFLAHAAKLLHDRRGTLAHCDVTLICEEPKIGPHREAMRARIAEILDVDVGRVSVKATTTDGLGFTGRREGIAAQATATVRLPA